MTMWEHAYNYANLYAFSALSEAGLSPAGYANWFVERGEHGDHTRLVREYIEAHQG